MRLKSFFADSVEEAIRQAREAMGPDAMLVNSKRSGAEAQHLGAYEVVICAEEPEVRSSNSSERAHSSRSSDLSITNLSQDVSELRRQMERLAVKLTDPGNGMSSNPEFVKAFHSLTDAELDLNLAHELMSKAGSPVSAATLRTELKGLLRVDPELGCAGSETRRVAVVGPPGAGKTSALVKLAKRFGITAQRPCQILSMDTYRIGASDELRSYAAILGMGCQLLETPAALAQALEEHRHKELILIDTPGLCRSEMENYEDMARFLASCSGLDTHLVLPAPMRAADLKRIADQYEIFKPRKLLLTRLDETQVFGPVLSHSVRTGTPISFVSSGQRIPEDLEAATPDLLVNLILRAEGPQERFDKAAA
jgi:flagellar biosynthesis protein FlhF